MEEKDFTITISRTSYIDFEVSATSLEEAKDAALHEAYNTNWGGKEAEYAIEEVN